MLELLKHHKYLKWPFKTMGKIATSNKTQFTTERSINTHIEISAYLVIKGKQIKIPVYKFLPFIVNVQ